MAENKPLVYLPPFHEAQKIVAADSSRFIVINAGRRWGKALSLDTPILTTDGWSTMGELRVGQMVFGGDGKPTRVVEATEVMFGHDVYEVHFSDGSVIKADADHQWFVHSKAYRKRPGPKYKTVYTTRELLEAGVNLPRPDGKVEHRFAVPVAAPLEYPERNFIFDPYSLGVWLGDGTSTDTTITLVEPEIVENFAYPMHQLGPMLWSFSGEPKSHHRNLLRQLGVVANKHVPEEYYTGSFQQRLALMQGLMDTGGYVSETGHCEFTSTSERLADDFLRLALTLGIKATLITGDAALYGRFISKKYRVKFTTTLPVARLRYKAERLPRSVKSDTGRRFITAIVPVRSEPVRCIAVDNADHLFLAGKTLIPTHNSWFARMMCLDHAINHGHQVWWISPTYGNVWDHWQQTLSMVGDLPTYKNVQQKYLEFDYRGRKGSLSFRSGERPDNLRGSGLDFVVLDEAAFIHPDVWEAVVRPALSDKRGRALIISTPNGVGDWYHRSYLRGLDPSYEEWNTYHFPTTANSTIPGIKQEVEQAKRDMDDLRFRQEYLAEFVDYAGGVFYGLQEAATAPLITIPVDGHAYYAGIDIGRRNDFTVISIIDLLERDFARQVAIERFSSLSFVAQEEKIAKTLEDWNIIRAFMENNSIAMPLVEALQQRGLPVVDHATSSANKGPMIEKLSANIQRGRLEILSPESAIGQVQLSEMQAFEMNKNATGYITYGAKRGWHDDTVMALAFVNMAIRSRGKGIKQQENPFYS